MLKTRASGFATCLSLTQWKRKHWRQAPFNVHSYHCACFTMCKGDLFSGKGSWFILIANLNGFREPWKLVDYIHELIFERRRGKEERSPRIWGSSSQGGDTGTSSFSDSWCYDVNCSAPSSHLTEYDGFTPVKPWATRSLTSVFTQVFLQCQKDNPKCLCFYWILKVVCYHQ